MPAEPSRCAMLVFAAPSTTLDPVLGDKKRWLVGQGRSPMENPRQVGDFMVISWAFATELQWYDLGGCLKIGVIGSPLMAKFSITMMIHQWMEWGTLCSAKPKQERRWFKLGIVWNHQKWFRSMITLSIDPKPATWHNSDFCFDKGIAIFATYKLLIMEHGYSCSWINYWLLSCVIMVTLW